MRHCFGMMYECYQYYLYEPGSVHFPVLTPFQKTTRIILISIIITIHPPRPMHFPDVPDPVPDSYWDNVTFSDVTVILYPTYYGRYANTSCQPTGCTQIFGPGRSQMKAPANQERIVRLETGHALFGLDDTFCGDTYYWQNDPYPNVWSSLASCQADAQSHNRDPAQCRQIESDIPRRPASGISGNGIRCPMLWQARMAEHLGTRPRKGSTTSCHRPALASRHNQEPVARHVHGLQPGAG